MLTIPITNSLVSRNTHTHNFRIINETKKTQLFISGKAHILNLNT